MTPWQHNPSGNLAPLRDSGERTEWGRSLPPWLNVVSHSLNATCVGMVFGEILLNFSKGTSLWEPSGFLTGTIVGTAGIYSAAAVVYLAKRRIRSGPAR
jgi:hypothetical protein